jgi:hypothetical protein
MAAGLEEAAWGLADAGRVSKGQQSNKGAASGRALFWWGEGMKSGEGI